MIKKICLKRSIAILFSLFVVSVLAVSDLSDLPLEGTLGERLESQLTEMRVQFRDGHEIDALYLADGSLSVMYRTESQTPRFVLSSNDELKELVLIDLLNQQQAVFHDKVQQGRLFHAAMTLRLLKQADCDEASRRRSFDADSCTPPNLNDLEWHGSVLVTDEMTFAKESQTKVAPGNLIANAANDATTTWFRFDSSDIEVEISVSPYETARNAVTYPALERAPISTLTGGTQSYDAIVRHAGASIGGVGWQQRDRTLSWNLEGITKGWVDDSRVPGGIRFDPSLQWAASQSYLFWLNRELYVEIETNPAYRYPSDESSNSSQINLEAIERDDSPPSVIGLNRPDDDCDNTEFYDGCTGLHWLDSSFLRPCCDSHDHCYRLNDPSVSCRAESWLFFWKRWGCTWCNVKVVGCFVSFSLVDFNHECSIHKGDDSDSGEGSDSGEEGNG